MMQDARFVSLEDGGYDTIAFGKYMQGMRGEANMTQPVLTKLADKCTEHTDHRDMCQRCYNFKRCVIQEEIKHFGSGNYDRLEKY